MKWSRCHIITAFYCVFTAVPAFYSAQQEGFRFKDEPAEKQIALTYNGQLITAYCFYDSIRKPFLYPLNTLDGITVTRGYPIHPLPGEPTDHPHHTGSWLNYESVNGLDFWNNSTAIPTAKRNLYGTIVHTGITRETAHGNHATLEAAADWLRPDGHCLLKEKTVYQFIVEDSVLILDRITTLTAQDIKVDFADSKDGFFAIRVAKELQQPAQQPSTFTDIHGNKTSVQQTGTDATGRYYSSEGRTGDSVWGTRGRWVALRGRKGGKDIAIAMFDHPENVGYPAYWHARGYGLFAVNPLGQKVFSNGKEALNFALRPHQQVTFRYRVLIASKDVGNAQIEAFSKAFAEAGGRWRP